MQANAAPECPLVRANFSCFDTNGNPNGERDDACWVRLSSVLFVVSDNHEGSGLHSLAPRSRQRSAWIVHVAVWCGFACLFKTNRHVVFTESFVVIVFCSVLRGDHETSGSGCRASAGFARVWARRTRQRPAVCGLHRSEGEGGRHFDRNGPGRTSMSWSSRWTRHERLLDNPR